MGCCCKQTFEKNVEEEEAFCWYERKYADKTTCHGISCVFGHESYCAKSAWIIILLAFTGAMGYQATLNLIEFLQFDSSTDVERTYSTEIDFPAITFCNFNRFFLEERGKKGSDKELDFKHYLNRVNSPEYYQDEWTTNYTNQGNFFVPPDIFVYSKYLNAKGFNLSSALFSCRWGSEYCYSENFTTILTEMGQCYTFNGGIGYTNQIKQKSPGTNKGLRIILDAMHWQYTEEELVGNEESGIKFLVHDPNEVPNVLQYGYSIPPGQKAFATLTKRSYELVTQPWGQCDDEPKKLKYFTNYTIDGCLTECHTDQLIERCGCHTFYQGWAHKTTPECTITQLLECATPEIADIRENYSMDECKCTIPCEMNEYDVTMSFATYPGFQIVEWYKDNVNQDQANYVRDNYVALDIGFSIIGYEKSVQSEAYTWQSLFSNFGGSFGLWTGISMFTVVEFMYFIFKKMRFCMFGRQTAPPSNSVDHEFGSRNRGYSEGDGNGFGRSPNKMEDMYSNSSFTKPPPSTVVTVDPGRRY